MPRPKYSDERKEEEGRTLKKYLSQTKLKELSLTQAKLAKEIGVSPAVISQWIAGVTRVPDVHWIYLSRRLGFQALHLRPELLSAFVGVTSLDTAMRIERLTKDQRALVTALIDLIEGLDIKIN